MPSLHSRKLQRDRLHGEREQLRARAPALQEAGAVGREVQCRLVPGQPGPVFVDGDLQALPDERRRGGEPAEPGAGDSHPQVPCHVSPPGITRLR
nr:hypothetical protein [Streptomyces sp. CNQ-509]